MKSLVDNIKNKSPDYDYERGVRIKSQHLSSIPLNFLESKTGINPNMIRDYITPSIATSVKNYIHPDIDSTKLDNREVFNQQNKMNCKQNHEELNEENDSDEELSKFIQKMKTRTIIIGIGGAGNNAISRIQEAGVEYAETLAVNTDAQDLFYSNSDKKLLIGKKITKGLGAGNNPEIGEKAAIEDINRIIPYVSRDVVFITCGLGGGTGTGAAPIIAREAKKKGALVVTFCTLPFKMEGEMKRIVANAGLKNLAEYSDTIIPLPNEKLLGLIPDLSLMRGFKIMDEVLLRSIKGIVDLISKCGLVNLDLADVRDILKKRERSSGIIGFTEINLDKFKNNPRSVGNTHHIIKKLTQSESGLEADEKQIKSYISKKVIKALKNPLISTDISKIESCLISIQGGPDLSLFEINTIVSAVSNSISPNARIKFGAMIEPQCKNLKVTLIGAGPESIYITQAKHIVKDQPNLTEVEFVL